MKKWIGLEPKSCCCQSFHPPNCGKKPAAGTSMERNWFDYKIAMSGTFAWAPRTKKWSPTCSAEKSDRIASYLWPSIKFKQNFVMKFVHGLDSCGVENSSWKMRIVSTRMKPAHNTIINGCTMPTAAFFHEPAWNFVPLKRTLDSLEVFPHMSSWYWPIPERSWLSLTRIAPMLQMSNVQRSSLPHSKVQRLRNP